MEKAKGFSGGSFATRKPVTGDGVAPTELENIKDVEERAKIQGELAKKLNKLMNLKEGTNARRDYIESLRPRLSAEAL